MEDLAISGRMAPRCTRAAKQKRGYCSLWEKPNGTWPYGFCKPIYPRSGHWPLIDENREILFWETHQKVLQSVTPENKYVLSLANLMVLFIVIPVNYTGQIRSKLVSNCNSNGIDSRTLWQSWNEPEIGVLGTIRFLLQWAISLLSFAAPAHLGTSQQIYLCEILHRDWMQKQ